MYIKNGIYKKDVVTAVEMIPAVGKLFGKTFLITGATGLVASFIIDILMYLNSEKNAKIKVYALGRDKSRLQQRYQSYKNSEWLNFIVQDVCEPIAMSENADYIIHAAGNGYPSAFRENPVGTMTPALLGTYYVMEYARCHQVSRVLYISSGEVYGEGQNDIDAFHEPYSGYIDILNPRSCYPSAKRAAETLCVSYMQQYHIDTVITRLAHTFGPNTTVYDNRANTQFINNVLRNEDIILKSAGKQMRSYTYIADCASGILTALLHGKIGEAYNVANVNEKVTIAEFAEAVALAGNRKCIYENPNELELAEQTPISYAVLDSTKLQSLGWQSQYQVKTGIEHTLAILKALQATEQQ